MHMRALIASGTGRYADPWHPYAETSPLLSDVLSEGGFEVEIDDDVDRAMTRLADVELLVVNAGDPWRSGRDGLTPQASIDGLSAALAQGVGVLAVHAALASLRDYPEWAAMIGAMWIPGLSWHPERGAVTVRGLAFPDGSAVADVDVDDEQYLRLQRIGRSHTVAEHEVDGARHPAVWVRDHGPARIAVDALGHDERSYDSADHRALLLRLAHWATEHRTG